MWAERSSDSWSMHTADFEKLATNYSRKRSIPPSELGEVIKFIASSTSGKDRLLDIGCGQGRILKPLIRAIHPAVAVGLDNSPGMLKSLRCSRNSGADSNALHIVRADFSISLPFRNSVFDVALLFQVVHCAPLPSLISEVSRVLMNSGVAVVASTSHDQFPQLAYCANPKIVKEERARTPNTDSIVGAFHARGFTLGAQKSFQWRRSFGSRAAVSEWIKTAPFSVLSKISQPELYELSTNVANRAERIANRYSVIDDAVRVLVFNR
jgi:ubiquinone/menaquinone biosynthesis C-methylase UbiE